MYVINYIISIANVTDLRSTYGYRVTQYKR